MNRGAWWAIVDRVAKSQIQLTFSLLFTAHIYEISIVNHFIIIATVELLLWKTIYITSRFYAYI